MKITRNQSVAAVATVIVAVCLLFSYLASDYGSDDGFRYEEAPGDYIALTIWNEDGDCSTHRVALISDEGDQSLYMIRTFGDIHRMLELDHGFITYVLYTVPDDAVPEGRETVFTSMGEFECDVLRDSNGDRYWVESHGMVLIHESTFWVWSVDSTSMAGIGTSESVSSRTDIRVDDFFA